MGRCTFDAEARCLRDAAGGSIALTAMEFDLLDVFTRHPRQILSRARLSELAHGRPLEPGDRSVDIRITRLRAKIGEDARAPRTLRTVHGEGYLYDPDA
jgi:DNA-binding response OmpR family regulator